MATSSLRNQNGSELHPLSLCLRQDSLRRPPNRVRLDSLWRPWRVAMLIALESQMVPEPEAPSEPGIGFVYTPGDGRKPFICDAEGHVSQLDEVHNVPWKAVCSDVPMESFVFDCHAGKSMQPSTSHTTGPSPTTSPTTTPLEVASDKQQATPTHDKQQATPWTYSLEDAVPTQRRVDSLEDAMPTQNFVPINGQLVASMPTWWQQMVAQFDINNLI